MIKTCPICNNARISIISKRCKDCALRSTLQEKKMDGMQSSVIDWVELEHFIADLVLEGLLLGRSSSAVARMIIREFKEKLEE